MKINEHISEVAKKHGITGTFSEEVLQYIWNNKNRQGLFVVSIVKVNKAGDKRKIKVGIIKDGEFVEATKLISVITELKFCKDDFTVKVNGGGMDMVFALLEQLYTRIAPKDEYCPAFKFTAVNSYKLF